jgi:hypothetical protein
MFPQRRVRPDVRKPPLDKILRDFDAYLRDEHFPFDTLHNAATIPELPGGLEDACANSKGISDRRFNLPAYHWPANCLAAPCAFCSEPAPNQQRRDDDGGDALVWPDRPCRQEQYP